MRDMARLWMQAALEAERTIAILDCDVPLVPANDDGRGPNGDIAL